MVGWRKIKTKDTGTSLVVQWLRLCTPRVEGPGSIPGQGTRSYMLQLRVRMPQLRTSGVMKKRPHVLQVKILHVSTMQPNKKYVF